MNKIIGRGNAGSMIIMSIFSCMLIQSVAAQSNNPWKRNWFTSAKQSEVTLSMERLTALCTAGTPLEKAVNIIAKEAPHDTKHLWTAIYKDVKAGKPFSQAVKKYPKAFTRSDSTLLERGENTSTFNDALKNVTAIMVARDHRANDEFGKKGQATVATILAIGTIIALIVAIEDHR